MAFSLDTIYCEQVKRYLQNRITGLKGSKADSLSSIAIFLKGETEERESNFDYVKNLLGASKYNYGASKIVFFFDQFPDIVIKVPFQGTLLRYMGYNDEFINTYDYFSSPKSDYDCKDYCQMEEMIYQQAVKEHLESFFAETRFLFSVSPQGVDFYIAENAEIPLVEQNLLSETPKFHTYKAQSYEIMEDISYHLDPLIVTAFLCESSTAQVSKFFDFLIHDFKIKDLHIDNFGYNKEHFFQILDYSGFND